MPVPPLSYDQLVNQTLGAGAWSGNAPARDTNDVVGALFAPDRDHFRANFAARLGRLASQYQGHANWSDLIVQVREVGSQKNWQGAFAELSAFDFFTASMDHLAEAPALNASIVGTRTLTSKFGNPGPANLDVHFHDFDTFTDVKVMQDNVAAILDSAYKKVVYPTPKPLLRAEYPLDASYEELQRNLSAIVGTLNVELNTGATPRLIKVPAVPELIFRVDWSGRMLTTEGGYSPYRHAEEAHGLPFVHAKKFIVDRPFFLTFVVFPWFNNRITDFGNSNRILYRSLSRRVFCQYRHSALRFSQMFPKYTGAETVFEVSRFLSGILFLEDTTIMGDNPSSTNAKGYWYANPNAHHPVTRLMRDYLNSLPLVEQDDFAFDNY